MVKKYFYKDRQTLQHHLNTFFLGYSLGASPIHYAHPLKVLNAVSSHEKLQVFLQSNAGKSLFNPMYESPKPNS